MFFIQTPIQIFLSPSATFFFYHLATLDNKDTVPYLQVSVYHLLQGVALGIYSEGSIYQK